jgi:hypothetical protein
MEIIIRLKIAFYAVKIDQDIIELFQEEEATCHTLTTWNSVALSG